MNSVKIMKMADGKHIVRCSQTNDLLSTHDSRILAFKWAKQNDYRITYVMSPASQEEDNGRES